MKKFALLFTLLFAAHAEASWVKRFGVSDQEYRVSITTSDTARTTAGFYLTSFPCYSQNSSEYYKTMPGHSTITIYCLEPPKEIHLAYVTKPNGSFFTRNDGMDGYMLCPVRISGLGSGGVVPRLEVSIQECEKREINPRGNKQILGMGISGAGRPVSEIMAPAEAKKNGPGTGAKPADQPGADKAGKASLSSGAGKAVQPEAKPRTDEEEDFPEFSF